MALAMPDDAHMPDTAWDALARELDAWAAAGKTATLWWRDDDASRAAPALDRLLALRDDLDVPLALAVIPARADASLRDRLAAEPAVAVLQHGYSHKNFAGGEGRKIELDDSRPAEYVVADLAMGGQALEKFANRLPVLVPPWNRIAPHLVPFLPEVGIRGLSTIGARTRKDPIRGLLQNNVHLDVIDWRGKRSGQARGFLGVGNVIADAVAHLSARRTGAADADEATGLLTHHADMDLGTFEFAAEFVNRTQAHPAVVWQPASEVFSCP
jgi:hypothetical protein